MSNSLRTDDEDKLPGDNGSPTENQLAKDTSTKQAKGVEEQEHTNLQITKAPKRKPIESFVLTPNDTNDPSYTNLILPYSVLCRQRYHQAGIHQRQQFTKEIKAHELLRSKALDGVRLHREFCNPVISRISPKEKITLTKKQQEKLEQLLQEP